MLIVSCGDGACRVLMDPQKHQNVFCRFITRCTKFAREGDALCNARFDSDRLNSLVVGLSSGPPEVLMMTTRVNLRSHLKVNEISGCYLIMPSTSSPNVCHYGQQFGIHFARDQVRLSSKWFNKDGSIINWILKSILEPSPFMRFRLTIYSSAQD